ncbi:unnamed protein product, partial [Arabidopsis halleri]
LCSVSSLRLCLGFVVSFYPGGFESYIVWQYLFHIHV